MALVLVTLIASCAYLLMYSSLSFLARSLALAGTTVLSLAIGLLSICQCHGLFLALEFRPAASSAKFFLFKVVRGDYKDLDREFEQVESSVKDHQGFKKLFSDGKAGFLGIYFDNPRLAGDKSKCRCCIGAFFDDKFMVTTELSTLLASKAGCGEKLQLPAVKALVARFPFRSKLSYLVAVFKVLPALERTLQAGSAYSAVYSEGKLLSPICEFYGKSEIVYALPVGDERAAYADLAPFMPVEERT